MTTSTVVARRAVLLVAIFGIGAALVAARYEPEPPCVIAQRWVEDHADALPTSLDAFSSFDRPFRRAIYAALNDEQRAALWGEHFRKLVARKTLALSMSERSFVLNLEADVDNLFSLPRLARQAKLEQVLADAFIVFKADRAKIGAVLFAIGAPPDEFKPSPMRTAGVAAAKVGSRSAVNYFCNCSLSGDPRRSCEIEGLLGECTNESPQCFPRPERPSCGTMGEFSCDGVCL